jgi:MFS transporter, DHA2 family, multidrug resistance protein
LLSKGQEWDWFGDPFWRVQSLTAIFVVGLFALVVRETGIENPLINFRTLADRNFRACCVIIFCAFGVLYANTTTLPAMLQTLFGYDATRSGLVLSPSGVFSVIMLFIVGALLSRGMDARYAIGAGLAVMGLGNFWLSRLNLEVSPWQIVWPRVVIIAGLSMVFAPLNVAAFMYIPKEMRGAAVGLLALLRNEGGSVGTSVAKIIVDRREQFHTLRLNETLDQYNPLLNNMFKQGQTFFYQNTGDPVASQKLALGALEQIRDQQALSLSYFDVFWACSALAVFLVFLVLLMRRSVPEKGVHIAAE